MLPHDRGRNRQAEPCALFARLGREERLEQPGLCLGAHTRARVADRNEDTSIALGRRNRHLVGLWRAFWDRLRGVDQEIRQDLGQLRPAAADAKIFLAADDEARAVRDLRLHQPAGVVDDVIEGQRFERVILNPREVTQAAHDGGDAIDAPDVLARDRPGLLSDRFQARCADTGFEPVQEFLEGREVEEDERRRVVDFVRHTRRQLANGRQALGADHLLLVGPLALLLYLHFLGEHVHARREPVHQIPPVSDGRALAEVVGGNGDDDIDDLGQARFVGGVGVGLRRGASVSHGRTPATSRRLRPR